MFCGEELVAYITHNARQWQKQNICYVAWQCVKIKHGLRNRWSHRFTHGLKVICRRCWSSYPARYKGSVILNNTSSKINEISPLVLIATIYLLEDHIRNYAVLCDVPHVFSACQH
jgi:hypothetical protein